MKVELGTNQPVSRLRHRILQIVVVLAILYVISLRHYLLFHSLTEFFGAAIGLAIFMLAWNSRKFTENNYFLFIGTALAVVGIISVIHNLSYRGMNVFEGTLTSSNLATQLWLATQYVLAGTFFLAPFLLNKKLKSSTILLSYLAVFTFLMLAIFFWKIFPVAYAEGTGLTAFKKNSEYIVAILFLLSLLLFWRKKQLLNETVFKLFSFMLGLFFLSTISFTLYVGVTDFFNMLGHELRVLAFYGGYLGMVEFGLMKPYGSMFAELQKKGKKILEAKEEWERTFDSLPDLIAIIDGKHKIVRANKAMAERLGLESGKQCQGLLCYKAVHNLSKPISHCPHAASLKDGKEHVEEIYEPNLRGNFLVSTTPLRNEKGEVLGCVHVARDITAHKEAEKIMADLAKFPLENPNPVMRMTNDGKLLYSNPAAEAVFKDLRIGREDALPDDWQKIVKTAFSENSKKSFEAGIDGKTFAVLITPVAGEPYANIYCTDISERKDAEALLVYEKEKLNQILDNMEDGVYIATKDHRIIYANPALKKIFGEHLRDKKCFEYMHDRKSACPWCMNKEVFSGKSIRWECYFSKNKKTFDIIETPMVSPDGTPIKLEIFRDVTEKKKIEKVRDEFISLASHQLRTPLASIGLSSELLLRGISGEVSKEQKEYLEEIHKATKRMTLLTNNLLNVSRLEMGIFSTNAEPLDVLSVLKMKLKELIPLAADKNLKIRESFEKNIPLISFNTKSFEIVFDNLLSNAIRYTPPGGQISLELKKESKKSILLKVTDTGWGIPEKQKDKVFEKSFRAENAKEISSEGAGLGLYMVREIADRTGSKVWFESKEGRGTTFYFSIPTA